MVRESIRVPAGNARALGAKFWIGFVANFGGRCQLIVGVAKFVANSSTYCTYESCPTHCIHVLQLQDYTANILNIFLGACWVLNYYYH